MQSIYCNITARHAAMAFLALCLMLLSRTDSYGQETADAGFNRASLPQARKHSPEGTEKDESRHTESSSPSSVLDFDDQVFSYMADHGSRVFTKGNIKITYLNQAKENWHETDADGEGGSAALMAFAYSGAESIVVETIDGSELDFRSFFVSVWGRGVASIEGSRDGVSTGIQTSGFPKSKGLVLLDNSIFGNVDKMVINSHSEGFWDVFDSFIFGSAIDSDNR